MASYATFADVEARAGRYAPLFSVAGKQPDETTIEKLLVDVEAEINAAIAARGISTPVTDAAAKAALLDVTAYGALARALIGVPGDDGLEELQKYAQAVWLAALAAIAKGTFPAVAALESAGAGASAGDFWEENPDYGTPEQVQAEALTLTPSLAPGFAKGQSL
ncbi:MAG TPA: hypothetical protein VI540_03660 [Gaiellaceae bacterium]|nr:hypothetical protein [Gaiellaceae bacterium]